MKKRLITPERIKELEKKEENKLILIEKLRLAGCSAEEIVNLIK